MPNALARLFSSLGGSLMARSGRVGILGTTGARTGVARRAPLGFVARPDGTVLIGSGRPDNHGWVVNLKANPSCTFAIHGTERHYRARLLDASEREPALAELAARMGTIAERTPWGDLFVLEPAAEEPA